MYSNVWYLRIIFKIISQISPKDMKKSILWSLICVGFNFPKTPSQSSQYGRLGAVEQCFILLYICNFKPILARSGNSIKSRLTLKILFIDLLWQKFGNKIKITFRNLFLESIPRFDENACFRLSYKLTHFCVFPRPKSEISF